MPKNNIVWHTHYSPFPVEQSGKKLAELVYGETEIEQGVVTAPMMEME